MLDNRTSQHIAAAWRTEIETSLESGQTPLLVVGRPFLELETAPTLLALQALAATRLDVTRPVVAVGGSGAAWPAALLLSRDSGRAPRAPDLRIYYTGADAATTMATLAIHQRSAADLPQQSPALRRLLAQSHEVNWQFEPRRTPGAATWWETLPFWLKDDPDREDVPAEQMIGVLLAVLAIIVLAALF